MVEEDRPTGPAEGEPSDSRYFGPFGEPPPTPQGTQPSQLGPTFEAHDATWPPPLGQLPLVEGPPGDTSSVTTAILPAGQTGRRRPRSATLIAVAALTALVIGGAAGYGGATVAQRTGTVGTTASPSAPPGVTRTPVPPAPPSANTVEVAKRVLPATVMIQAGRGTGSGFLIDRDGRIVTNNHVVADAADGSRIRVIFSDGRRLNALLVGRSPSYDIAVIRVSGVASLQPSSLAIPTRSKSESQ